MIQITKARNGYVVTYDGPMIAGPFDRGDSMTVYTDIQQVLAAVREALENPPKTPTPYGVARAFPESGLDAIAHELGVPPKSVKAHLREQFKGEEWKTGDEDEKS